jgi:hypothetical protein
MAIKKGGFIKKPTTEVWDLVDGKHRFRPKGSAAEDFTIARYKNRIRNAQSAIRSFCIECMGGCEKSVTECVSVECSLYHFRMGKNPFHSKSRVRARLTKK